MFRNFLVIIILSLGLTVGCSPKEEIKKELTQEFNQKIDEQKKEFDSQLERQKQELDSQMEKQKQEYEQNIQQLKNENELLKEGIQKNDPVKFLIKIILTVFSLVILLFIIKKVYRIIKRNK